MGLVVFEKFVFLGLVFPLLLISDNFSDPNEEPQSDAAVIYDCEFSLVGVFDWGREPYLHR